MSGNNYQLLKFSHFNNFYKWDVKQFLSTKIKSSYSIKELGSVIVEQSTKIKLSREPEKEFGILGVSNEVGMFDAYIEKGKNINQPYKIVKDDFIAYNPYRVNVGSIGIKKSYLLNSFISSAYVVFSTKENLLPDYLFILTQTDIFNQLIRENTTGSVRQTLGFENLAKIEIPVPPKDIQEKLVANYNETMEQAKVAEEKTSEYETEIEEYLFNELGISKISIPPKQLVYFTSYKNITAKWTYSPLQVAILKMFEKTKYPIKRLGECTKFVTRTWKKRNDKTFSYIELGSIDSQTNIIEASIVETLKAPSRATQIVLANDLILGMTRPYLKKFAIISEKEDNYVCSSGFQVIQNSTSYNSNYILEVLKSSICIEQFNEKMTGALYPAVNSEQLSEIMIPLPPIEIQNQLVKHIDGIKAEIKKLREQAQGLRQKAKKDFKEGVFDE